MKEGLYSDSFSLTFSKLLKKTGVSYYSIAQYADIDQAYLSRLKNGEKTNPSPETIMRISLALARLSDKIHLADIELLFNSTGRSIISRP